MADNESGFPLVDKILSQWQDVVVADFPAYRNHVYRLLCFCNLFYRGNEEEQQRLAIAACFHDLAIWTEDSFDYLEPSIALATDYLRETDREAWSQEVALMIRYHHKMTKYRDERFPLVEVFRKADWVDVSRGRISFGLAQHDVSTILQRFPNQGFHKRLIALTARQWRKSWLRPLPMLKW